MENDARFMSQLSLSLSPARHVNNQWIGIVYISIRIKLSTAVNTRGKKKKKLLLYFPHPPLKATRCNYCERIKFSFLSFNYSTCLLSFNIVWMRVYNVAVAWSYNGETLL